MHYEFPCSRRLKAMALTCAVTLHTGIAAWAMQPSDPAVIPDQQVIRIAMVAPSNPMEVEPVAEQKPEPIVPPKDNGLKTVKKEPEKKVEKQEEVRNELPKPANQQTTGRQAEDAVEDNAAITEPVVDAAYLNNHTRPYPKAARRRGLEGKVMLDVLVSTQGLPKALKVADSSGHKILDEEALEVVQGWRFHPARRGSQLVEAWVEIPYEFRLN